MTGQPTASVQCPQCEEVIDIPIEVIITSPEDDQQFIRCEPDLTDVWAHAWTHEDPATVERMRMGIPVATTPPRPVPVDPGWELEVAKTPRWFWPVIALLVIVFVGGPVAVVALL
jgi:hypothetical protein